MERIAVGMTSEAGRQARRLSHPAEPSAWAFCLGCRIVIAVREPFVPGLELLGFGSPFIRSLKSRFTRFIGRLELIARVRATGGKLALAWNCRRR